MDETHEDIDQRDEGDGEITIYIDRSAFRVLRQALTGRVLRELATPAIGAEYELYHVSPGSEPDLLVHDEEVVELEEGTQFFSAPKMIMAGSAQPRPRGREPLLFTPCTTAAGGYFVAAM